MLQNSHIWGATNNFSSTWPSHFLMSCQFLISYLYQKRRLSDRQLLKCNLILLFSKLFDMLCLITYISRNAHKTFDRTKAVCLVMLFVHLPLHQPLISLNFYGILCPAHKIVVLSPLVLEIRPRLCAC